MIDDAALMKHERLGAPWHPHAHRDRSLCHCWEAGEELEGGRRRFLLAYHPDGWLLWDGVAQRQLFAEPQRISVRLAAEHALAIIGEVLAA